MPRDGSGNFTLVSGNPVVTNTVISASGWANPTMSDFASGLTQSLSRDGQTTPTANLTMGNFQLLNLGNGTTRAAAVNAGQIQDGGLITLGGVSGTDTITASDSPAITVYTAGQTFDFSAASANTTNAVTLNINALGAKNVMKPGPTGVVQLSPGDLQTGQTVRIRYDGTEFVVISPLAPNVPIGLVNKSLNGNFDIWQRGTSFTNATTPVNAYTADGWQVYRSTFANNYTVTQGTGFVPTGSRYSLFVQRTAGDTSVQTINVAQSYETNDVIKWRGKTMTLSFLVEGNGAFVGATFSQQIISGTGTDGNLSAGFTGTNTVTSSSVVLTGAYVQGTVTFTVPSNATQFGINFSLTPSSTAAGASDFFQLAQVQINEGGSALPFERRSYAMEFTLCRRQYRLISTASMWGYSSAGAFLGQTIPFDDMRASPTVTAISPTYSNASALTVQTTSANSLTVAATVTALGAASWSAAFTLNASL